MVNVKLELFDSFLDNLGFIMAGLLLLLSWFEEIS